MMRTRFALLLALLATLMLAACQAQPVRFDELQMSDFEPLTIGSKRFDHFSITNMSADAVDVTFEVYRNTVLLPNTYNVHVEACCTMGFVTNLDVSDARYVDKVVCEIDDFEATVIGHDGCAIKSAKFWFGPESDAGGAAMHLSGEAVLNTGLTVKHEPY